MRSLLYLNLRDDYFYCQAIDTLLSSHQHLYCMGNYHCMLCSWGMISSKNKRNNHPRGLIVKKNIRRGILSCHKPSKAKNKRKKTWVNGKNLLGKKVPREQNCIKDDETSDAFLPQGKSLRSSTGHLSRGLSLPKENQPGMVCDDFQSQHLKRDFVLPGGSHNSKLLMRFYGNPDIHNIWV